MCYYVKDDYEQCGMDEEPYCRHHDDSIQAELYDRMAERVGNTLEPTVLGMVWRSIETTIEEKVERGEIEEALSAAIGDAQRDSSSETMEHMCAHCERPVRRTVSVVKEAKFKPKRVVIEEQFGCDCGSVTIGTKEYAKADVPIGWY